MANNTNRNSKSKYILILLLVLIVAVAVAYAAFADTLTITGTANALGKFDLEFQTARLVTSEGVKTQKNDPTDETESVTDIAISQDKNTLEVKVVNLGYPGAGAQFHADIKNVGTVPAKITEVSTTGLENANRAIKVYGLDVFTDQHPKIEPNETCSLDFTVEWDENSDLENKVNGDKVDFSVIVKYEQSTDAFNGSASHTD